MNYKTKKRSSFSIFILIFLLSIFSTFAFATTWIKNAEGTSAWTSGYPDNNYDNYQNISTSLSINGATKLQITIQGEIEKEDDCGYDYLLITDEIGNQRKFCDNISETYIVEGSSITLRFDSDRSVTKKGVKVDIKIPQPSFSIEDITINEGNYGIYTKKIPVTLSNPNGNTVSVSYTTTNGTALAGEDYNATSGVLTFNGTETTKMISVKINGDNTQEPNQSFNINLSSPIGATIDNSSSQVTLINDDGGTSTIGLRDFRIRNPIHTQNIKGNIKVIGNTVLCKKVNGVCSETTATNNSTYLNFIDVDGIYRPYNNSSQAIISIPNTAKVVWSALYTQGYMNRSSSDTINAINSSPVYLTTPNGTNIQVTPNIIDLFRWDGYTYSTFSEVPELINMTGSQINGTWTGANIKAREGKDSSLGYFGAWTLVIIYEEKNESLKNISVFDGYRRVSSSSGYNEVLIPISGFLTPTNGNIASTLSIFAGEGDSGYTGDKLYVDNIAINDTNAFDSTTSGFIAIPSLKNNFGIDIQNHHIGTSGLDIIKNNQQNAVIKLTSTQDAYYPSMIAFTTELYEPRVCYSQEFLDENGNEITGGVNVGDTITVSTWISNMKQIDEATGLPEEGDLEVADKVEITMNLDSINFEYISNSTSIQNIGETQEHNKTDSKDSDTAEFLRDTNTSVWRVGTGSSGSDGGQLLPNLDNDDSKKVFIKFKTTLLESGDINITNKYFVSYENSLLGVRFGDESPFNIEVCKVFDSSLTVGAPLGVFNIVNQNFSASSISDDPLNSQNALYTQVSGQNFTVKLVALESDFKTLKPFTGDVTLSLIDTPAFTGNTSSDEILCNDAPETNTQTITLTNESLKALTLNYSIANEKVSFKISYDDRGTTKHVCSRDSFSIRPAKYTMTPDTTPLIGGKNHQLDIKATTISSSVLSGYNQIVKDTAEFEAKIDLDIPTGCTLPSNSTKLTMPFTFSSGSHTYAPFIYNNIGDVNVTITDKAWTATDQGSLNSKGYDDCILNSKTNTPDGSGKVGCELSTTQQFTFSPKEFQNRLSIQNFNSGNFTYIAGTDANMSADLNLQATAVLDDGTTTATNYTNGCFSKDINSTITLITNPTAQWLTNNSTAINRIVYLDDNGATTNFENNITAGQATLSSDKSNFNSGIANVTAHFNFSRSDTVPDEPFIINRNDFNLTIIDTNNVTGNSYNPTVNSTTKFYYGRSHAPDQRFDENPATASILYEVYCNNCNRATMGMNSYPESSDSINWYVNNDHTALNQGKFNNVNLTSADGTTMNTYQLNSVRLQAPKVPHKDKIQLNSDSWLVHAPTDFLVEFYSDQTGWAGEGKLGATVDTNVSTTQNRRLDW